MYKGKLRVWKVKAYNLVCNSLPDVCFKCEVERNAASMPQLEKHAVQEPCLPKFFSLHVSGFFLNRQRFELGCSWEDVVSGMHFSAGLSDGISVLVKFLSSSL